MCDYLLPWVLVMYSLNILRIFAAVFMTRILNQTASMNFYHNTILETLFGTVLLILCSCSGSSDDIKVNDPVRYSVIMKGMSFPIHHRPMRK